MKRIIEQWGALVAEVCRASSVPPEFLLALIANESGGDASAERFEPRVFERFKQIAAGNHPAWGAVTAQLLAGLGDDALRVLATSYGLTQVMGYNAAFRHVDPLALRDPRTCLQLTTRMLAEDAARFGLDLKTDFAEMFATWNSGNPRGHAVPGYIASGLAHLAEAQSLLGVKHA